MKYAQKPMNVQNPWNGNVYSFESYDPSEQEHELYQAGFVKYTDGNYYNIDNRVALNRLTREARNFSVIQ